MVKSKTLMIFAVLILLFTAVGFSGCLGGNDDNATPSENVTPPENITPPVDETPSEDVAPPVVEPTEKVNVSTTFDGDNSVLITIKNKRYSSTSVSISTGDAVRLWSREERNFRHIFQSEENAFEDFDLIPGYFAYLTFNQPGTYKIDMINYYTGEPHGDAPIVLTVTVT
ncbi:hypothetical protein [Methanimicrococcus blatticola]|uniref:EfeO-type cupredoxin-like domain-containing protein n=1 Tax=Methanimicrococcus blatticola TaxID=91560 RepID=A0A484F6E1_9EURY|nr:hypothetical protein [Methanimicrococcus blatticola]MBZ3934901.1 hypothetical protein [Methanimicrococcus blatticola]MCC2509000.1 hypothetical protein [Methanimicrococcus blatticola]TDQ70972.1 hypothetical protein C7391_0068 [Methanimicrococcus blatticola]